MKPRRISTDREGARALGRLMRPGASPQRLRPAGIPPKAGVVVEIIDEIPEGDYDQHQAKLLAVQGGSWQDTGNTVPVRHVGESAVPAETRVIVEPCGRLGLCFARTDNGRPEVLHSLGRFLRPVEQVAGHFGDEDTSWAFAIGPDIVTDNWNPQLPTWLQSGSTEPNWHAEATRTGTPTVTDSGNGWTAEWRQHLYPLRFEMTGNSGPYMRHGVLYGNQADDTWWSPARHFLNLDLAWAQYDWASSATTLGPDSHLWPMTLTGLSLEIPRMFYEDRTLQGALFLRAYRVWIDGTDETGVVSFTGTNPITFRKLVDVPDAEYQSKTISVDLWLDLVHSLSGNDRDGNGDPVYPTLNQTVAWSHGYGNGNICQLQSADIFANIPTGQKWTLTLNGGATVGDPAVSELINEESEDYTFSTENAVELWLWDNEDGVAFVWGREVPLIWVQVADKAFQPWPADEQFVGNILYAPQDSGDYDPITVDWFGSTFQPGVWDWDGTTTFVPVAALRSVQFPQNGQWEPITGQNGQFYDYLDGFPTSITVEPV